MPCYQPFRDDSAQLLLFKIASCLEATGGGAGVTSFNGLTGAVTGVTSFNGRDGVVILTLADVAAVADGRYVLKTGDTMTGALVHPDGTAALPSITFTGDLDTGIYHPAANTVGFAVAGAAIAGLTSTGLGIGTLTPTFRLELVGTASVANRKIGINGTQVVYLPDQAAGAFSGSLFLGSGGASLSHAAGTEGQFLTAVGIGALSSNTTGDRNTVVGYEALVVNTTGRNNTSVGLQSLFNNTTGTANTVVGYFTGAGITTGSNNTIIGANVTGLTAALSNNIIIADGAGAIRLQINSSGNTTLAGTVQTAAGTAALPAFSFTGDPNTGLYNIGADSIGTSTGGVLRITTNTTDIILATAFRLAMASGANQRAGNAVLVGGTVTVANTSVTANTIVLLTRKTSGGTIGFAVTYTVIAATSFTLTSDNALDTSTYSYLLIEVP